MCRRLIDATGKRIARFKDGADDDTLSDGGCSATDVASRSDIRQEIEVLIIFILAALSCTQLFL